MKKISENHNKSSTSLSLREKFSRAIPGFLGVKYWECTPIAAGQPSSHQDVTGRQLDFSQPPKDAIFYNLKPSETKTAPYSEFEMDYLVGNSDATENTEQRLKSGDLIYWSPVSNYDHLEFDDAVIVKLADTENEFDCTDIDENWLCLRRLGDEERNLVDQNGNFLVRSRSSEDGKITVDAISTNSIEGLIFSSFSVPKNHFRIQVAADFPFAPRAG